MLDKEPVDIFNTEGTSAPEAEPAPKEEDEDEEEGDEEEDESGEDDDSEDDEDEDEDEEGDDDNDDDESGDDDDDEKDPKQKEINRLNGLLKLKNNALREMRRIRRTGGSEAAAEQFKPPYPDLKRSHELPKEEQDDMTDREKKLHDDNIDVKQRLNEDAKKAWDREQKEKNDGIDPDALTEDEASDFVKASARFLAKGNTKIANQIIRKYNMFKNDGLTEEQIEDRLGEAAKMVKGYKAPKEMVTKKGKAVKKAKSGAATDNDSIVKSLDSSGVKKPISL